MKIYGWRRDNKWHPFVLLAEGSGFVITQEKNRFAKVYSRSFFNKNAVVMDPDKIKSHVVERLEMLQSKPLRVKRHIIAKCKYGWVDAQIVEDERTGKVSFLCPEPLEQ